MLTIDDFERKEKEIERNTRKDFKDELKFFEEGFTLSCEILSSISNKYINMPIEETTLIILLMGTRLLFATKSILNLATRGYYYDANILYRTFLENIGLCINLTRDKQNRDKWMEGKKIDVSSIKLVQGIGSFLLENIEKKRHDNLSKLYGQLSEYIHTYSRPMSQQFIGFPPDDTSIDLIQMPYYNSQNFREIGCTLSLQLLNIVLMKLLEGEISDDLKSKIINIRREWKMFKSNESSNPSLEDETKSDCNEKEN